MALFFHEVNYDLGKDFLGLGRVRGTHPGKFGVLNYCSVWLLLYVLGMGTKSVCCVPFLQLTYVFEDQFYSKNSLKSKEDFHGPMTYATV